MRVCGFIGRPAWVFGMIDGGSCMMHVVHGVETSEREALLAASSSSYC